MISKFLDKHSAASDVKDWNGETIVLFQEDLFSEVKAKVSEKWFYTYFKNEATKLPRVDMLNLLSSYIGFENWQTFKNTHPFASKHKKKVPWIIIFAPILIVFIVTMNGKNDFQFCFVDDLNNQAITNIPIDIKLLQEDQSPLYFKTDSLGCFRYKTKANLIRFVVSSPYHKTDTIVRSIEANQHHVVKLDSDDYALILKYYTNGNVKDWTKHKQKLQQLIHEDAQIYRLYEDNIGVEIYSKEDFVRLLTIPTKTLKTVKILDKSYENNQIKTLKFTVR
ncbi:hypothetical protein [Psychroserpens sp. SPM9]|uniref:hypothetical protein n=1 Tax=Psychroserpens sp. SPM9 TaxID=2975598 RepID=UPI0021A8CEE1|nr:hypothetical protein [Psychroserpens sp. SPM9]MDG5492296.1 hypothetical protein [Psychroserpens sp. SPM9]